MELNNIENFAADKPLDIRKIILRFLEFKWVYILLVFLFFIIAFFYNKLATPGYRNSTSILVNDDVSQKFLASRNMEGIQRLDATQTIDNIILTLNSHSIVKKTLEELDFKVTYYSKEPLFPNGFLKKQLSITRDIYKGAPFRVICDASHNQVIGCDFNIIIHDDETFEIQANGEAIAVYNYVDNKIVGHIPVFSLHQAYKFGEFIEAENYRFMITKAENFWIPDYSNGYNLFFTFNHIDYLTLAFKNSLTVSRASITSTILNVTITGDNYYMITDFLNTYIQIYLDENLKKKNQMAQATINFIDSQIGAVSDSLSSAESTLRNFRSSNQITDISFQGQRLVDQLNTLETQRDAVLTQKKYYDYLDDYLKKENTPTSLSVPSSMNVIDPVLSDLVSQFIAAITERNNLLSSSTVSEKNIYLRDIESKLNNIRKTILENIQSNKNNIQISINELNYRIKNISSEISQLPKKELQLVGIQRKFQLNNEIINYLMQKRSEAQIAKASSTPDIEVIDEARYLTPYPISPNKMINYLLAIILGLLLPTVTIIVIDFFNNKVRDRSQVTSMTNLPFLGYIYHNNKNTRFVLDEYPTSAVSESFRGIRTNLLFLNNASENKVFLVTSSASGEGKSFTSINIATAFANNGHRTLLVEFDLRRPNLAEHFNILDDFGVTSLLIRNALVDDVIKNTQIQNLDFIPAGPIAPNPAELIASPMIGEFLALVSESYDRIVLDTAPVGIVPESMLLMNRADVNIYVVRQNKTHLDSLRNTFEILKNNNIKHLAYIINDVTIHKRSYKYGYDSKYYYHKSKRRIKEKLSHLLRLSSKQKVVEKETI